MYDDSIKLIEMPEHDSISVCVYCENDGLFALGERINARFEQAYMNGYNWDALIKYYIGKHDPELMTQVNTDPEAGMFSAYTTFSDQNLALMKLFEEHVRKMVSNENLLMQFIEENENEIEWD